MPWIGQWELWGVGDTWSCCSFGVILYLGLTLSLPLFWRVTVGRILNPLKSLQFWNVDLHEDSSQPAHYHAIRIDTVPVTRSPRKLPLKKKKNKTADIYYIQPLLLLLLLSRFSRVWLCATPSTAAHQAPPSLGFSRQEHWSGLPFPSPMHESEKWKWSRSVVSDS